VAPYADVAVAPSVNFSLSIKREEKVKYLHLQPFLALTCLGRFNPFTGKNMNFLGKSDTKLNVYQYILGEIRMNSIILGCGKWPTMSVCRFENITKE